MNRKHISGFSLIEVIIAFLVIAMGSASLVQLHRGYLRQENNSTQREEAMHLAESKLDDLRHLEVLRSATDKIAYQDIGNNTGGTIVAGNRTLTTGSFNLSWSCRFGSTAPCPALAIRKDITVNVSWTQSDGSARSLALSSTISPQFSLGTNELSDNLSADETQPAVSYTPGSAPDVVAVTIKTSGTKVETSKPLPTFYQQGSSTVVQFETVTYDSETQKLTQEDQLTLSCNCSKQSGSASYYLPASFGGFWVTGAKNNKGYGLSNDNKNSRCPTCCTTCCNNHFDGSGSTFDQFFNQSRKHHDHYRLTGTTLTPSSSDYLEACRLLRIDGFYQPMPDWNLVALNVMSADYLTNSDNQANYERYVQDIVKQSYLNQKNNSNTAIPSLNTWLANYASGGSPTINTEVTAGSTTQLIARGIYVDRMDFSKDSYFYKLDADDGDLLSKLPFNEINLTLLANWSVPDSADQAYTTVTNDEIKPFDQSKPGDTYSRGRLGAIQNTPTSGAAATIEVQATVKNSNSGITSTQAISPSDTAATTSTIGITVSGGTNTTPVTIHGDIKCLTDPQNNKETTPQTCNKNQFKNLTVSSSNSGATCTTVAPIGNADTGYFECSVVRGSNVIINFSASGYVLTPNSISLPSSLTNQPASVSWYPLNTSGKCSLMMVKSTVASASTYSCN